MSEIAERKPITVLLDPSDIAELDRCAAQEDTRRSVLMRRVIRAYLKPKRQRREIAETPAQEDASNG